MAIGEELDLGRIQWGCRCVRIYDGPFDFRLTISADLDGRHVEASRDGLGALAFLVPVFLMASVIQTRLMSEGG